MYENLGILSLSFIHLRKNILALLTYFLLPCSPLRALPLPDQLFRMFVIQISWKNHRLLKEIEETAIGGFGEAVDVRKTNSYYNLLLMKCLAQY